MQFLHAVCCTDLIWSNSGSEFSTLLKMTLCYNIDRWPDIIHPFFFSCNFFHMPTPTLDWQGPVACHLLAMFGSRTCISCLRSLLLAPPFITHSDTLCHKDNWTPKIHSTQNLLVVHSRCTSGVNLPLHLHLKRKSSFVSVPSKIVILSTYEVILWVMQKDWPNE